MNEAESEPIHLPFNANITINEPVGALFYHFRNPPFEISSSPFSNPHTCFFHPITRQVSNNRSILILFYLISMITVTTALTMPLLFFGSQRKKFNNSVSNWAIVYILVQFLSLALMETSNYKLENLIIDIIEKIILILMSDMAYEYFFDTYMDRVLFHFISQLIIVSLYFAT